MGIISGYFGGIVDIVIMRIADMMISFQGVILAIAIAGIMGGSLINDRTDCGHMDQVCPPLPFHGPQDQAP